LSACGSEQVSGTRNLSPGIIASIRNGVTTRDQVRVLLGAPQSLKTQVPITQPPGLNPLPAKHTATEIWAYWITKESKPGLARKLLKSAKSRYTSLTVIIYFDGNGIVLDSQVQEGQYSAGSLPVVPEDAA
jgi:outer membrane protein assembly factor BamE (lipoprotein component of BamABCDE complex)